MVDLLTGSPTADIVRDALLHDVVLAPELLDVEVASALAGLQRGGKMTDIEADDALGVMLNAPVVRVPHGPLIRAAWSRRDRLSLYDAVYVSLAAEVGCPLITADRRLASSVNDIPVVVLPV